MKNTWIKRVWFQALVLALGLLVLGTNDAIAQTVEKDEILQRFDCKMSLVWRPVSKRFAFVADDVFVQTACVFEDYMWHHVVVSLDSNGVGQLFVDGKPQTLLDAQLNAHLGGQKFSTDVYPSKCPPGETGDCCTFRMASKCDTGVSSATFDGIIDESSVWNRTLDQEEVVDAMFKAPLGLPSRDVEAPRGNQVDISKGRVLWGRFNEGACANVAQDGLVTIAGLGVHSKYAYNGVPWLAPEISAAPSEIPLDGDVDIVMNGVGFAKSPFSHCVLVHPDPVGYFEQSTASRDTVLVGEISSNGRSKYKSLSSDLVTYSPAQSVDGLANDTATRGGKIPAFTAHATTQLLGFHNTMTCKAPKASQMAQGYQLAVSHDGGMTASNTKPTTAMEFSVEFDGSITLQGSGIPSQPNLFTLSLWVYPKKNVISSTILELGTNQNPFGLYFEGGLLVLRDNPVGGQGISYTPLTLNEWHYLQVEVGPVGIASNQLRARIDGMTFHGPTTMRSSNPALGVIGTGFHGYIDEVKIYDELIKDLSKAFSRELQQENLATYYRFNGNLKQSKVGGKFASDITTTSNVTYSSHFAPWEPSTVSSINGQSMQFYNGSIHHIEDDQLEITGFNFPESSFLTCKFGNATQRSSDVLTQYAQDNLYVCSVPSASQIIVGEGFESRSDGKEFTKYYYPSFEFDSDALSSSIERVSTSKVVCKIPTEIQPSVYTIYSFSVATGSSLTKLDMEMSGKSLKCDGSHVGLGDILLWNGQPKYFVEGTLFSYTVSFWTYALGEGKTLPQVVMAFEDYDKTYGSIMYNGETFSYFDENILHAEPMQQSTIDPSLWHFVVLSIDAEGEGKLYVDCELSSTFTTASRPVRRSQLNLCKSHLDTATGYQSYDGLIDELTIFHNASTMDGSCPSAFTDKSGAFASYDMTSGNADTTTKVLYDTTPNGNHADITMTPPTFVKATAPWEDPLALEWSVESSMDSVFYGNTTTVSVSGINLAPSPFFRLHSKHSTQATLSMAEDKKSIKSASIQVQGECYKDATLNITNNYVSSAGVGKLMSSEVGEVNLFRGLLAHYTMEGSEADRNMVSNGASKLPVEITMPQDASTICVWVLFEDYIDSHVLVGGWKFVCYVEAESGSSVYLNGYLIQGNVASSYESIMKDFKGSGQAFKNQSGVIDELWIYDRALDSCEIEARYFTSEYALEVGDADGTVLLPFTSSNEITLEAWIYPHSVDGLYSIATSKKDNEVSLALVDGSLALSVSSDSCTCTTCGDKHEYISEKAKVFQNKWIHVAASYNGKTMSFYTDGVLRDTIALVGAEKKIENVESLLLSSGTSVSPAYLPFSGLIYSLAVYPNARAADQIMASATCPYKSTAQVRLFNEKNSFELADKLVNASYSDPVDGQKMTLGMKKTSSSYTIVSGTAAPFAAIARTSCDKLAMSGGLTLAASLSKSGFQQPVSLVDTNDGNYHGVINTTGLACGDYKLNISPSNLVDIPVTILPGQTVASASEIVMPSSIECYGVPRTVSVVAKDSNGCPVLHGTDEFKIHVNGPYSETIDLQYVSEGVYSGIFKPQVPGKYSISGELSSGPEPGIVEAVCIDVCLGSSAEFNGSNSLLFSEHAKADLDLAFQAITMDFWVRASASGSNAHLLIKTDTSTMTGPIKGYDVSLDHSYDVLSVSLYTSLGEYRTLSAPGLSLMTEGWYHIAIVYTGTDLIIYGKGTQIAKKTFSSMQAVHTNPYAHPLEIGQGFKGYIDDVKLWKVALTQEEILESMYCPPYNKKDKLAAYFHFNEMESKTSGDVFTAGESSTVLASNIVPYSNLVPASAISGVGMDAVSAKYSKISFVGSEIQSKSTSITFTVQAYDKCGYRYTKKDQNTFKALALPLTETFEEKSSSSLTEYPIFTEGSPQDVSISTPGFLCSGGQAYNVSNEYYGIVNIEKVGKVKVIVGAETNFDVAETILNVIPSDAKSISIDKQYPMQSGFLSSVDFTVLDEGSNIIQTEFDIMVSFIVGQANMPDIPTSVIFEGGHYKLFFTPPVAGVYAITLKLKDQPSILIYLLTTVQPGISKPVIALGSNHPKTNTFEQSVLIKGNNLVTFAGATRDSLAYSNEVWILENYDVAAGVGLFSYQRRFAVSGTGTGGSAIVEIIVNTLDDITEGKMTSSCSDLYFVNANNHAMKLEYFINPHPGCGANNTVIYVKVPGEMLAGGSASIDLFYGGNVQSAPNSGEIYKFYSDFETGYGDLSVSCNKGSMETAISNNVVFEGLSSMKVTGSGDYLEAGVPTLSSYKLQAFMYDSGVALGSSHFLSLNDLFVNGNCKDDTLKELSGVAFGIHSGCHPNKYCVFDSSWRSTTLARYPHWVILEAESDGANLTLSIDGVAIHTMPAIPLSKILLSAGAITDQVTTTYWDEISVVEKPSVAFNVTEVSNRAAYFSPNSQWKRVGSTNGTSPPERLGHTAVLSSDESMVIFGGERNTYLFNDLWQFTFSTELWESITVTGVRPEPRYDHVAFMWQGDMYIHGGLSYDGKILDDMWRFNFTTKEWKQAGEGLSLLGSRFGHSVAQVGDRFYMFGGYSIGGATNDFFEFDLASGTAKRVASAPAMKPRFAHSSFADSDSIYISGGNNEDNEQMSGLWKYSVADQAWSFTDILDSTFCEHFAAPAIGGFLVHGGSCGDVPDYNLYHLPM